MQAYLIMALDKKIHGHGQLSDEEKNDYMNQLVFNRFVQLRRRDIASTSQQPYKYLIILDSWEDWNIPEILVMGNFDHHPELLRLVEELGIRVFTSSVGGQVDHHQEDGK